MCSKYKASHKWIRFLPLTVCFFWLLSGRRWNNDRKPASFGKISSLRMVLFHSSARERSLCNSPFVVASELIASIKYYERRMSVCLTVWNSRQYVFFPFTCLKSRSWVFFSLYPLSKPSFVPVSMQHTQLQHTQLRRSFHSAVCFADLWLHLKVMPQVRSNCMCCAVSLCTASLTASVWDWCFRRQTCAPHNAVFPETPL